MKLILTRHTKSDWDDLSLDDHDRPLTDRGRLAASKIGNWLTIMGHAPVNVKCSTAERAKWTCALAIENMPDRPSVSFEVGLYHATPDTILAEIRRGPPGDLMVVGHNPGISALATLLLPNRPEHPKFSQYPTGATTVLEADIESWREMDFSKGRLLDFVVPKDLMAQDET